MPTVRTGAQVESLSQRLVIAFTVTGLFFMLLPGTFLGVWNLIGIAQDRTLASIAPAWIQAHGQAQIFGWIGSFILGIGFYSLTKMQSLRNFPVRSGWFSWSMWTSGVSLRWLGGISGWHWTLLLPASALLQLGAFLLFWRAVRKHRPATEASSSIPAWMVAVVFGTVMLCIVLTMQFAVLCWLALSAQSPALPHVLDQQLVVFAVWGVLVPTIWGFNARWLPVFAGFDEPNGRELIAACIFVAAGVLAAFTPWLGLSASLLLIAAVLSIDALRVWDAAIRPAKTQNISHSFPFFIRIAYLWLVISCLLDALAVVADHSGGIWGASRHALTVGFVAGMVFVIGPRILPAFCGMRVLWSSSLMTASLVLLHLGCALRVAMEPLAYQHLWSPAWRLLPVSAFIELAGITIFALNLFVTLLRMPAHLASQSKTHCPGIARV